MTSSTQSQAAPPATSTAATIAPGRRGSSISADAMANHSVGIQSALTHQSGTRASTTIAAKVSGQPRGRPPRAAARLCRN